MNQRTVVPQTTHITDAPTARRPIVPQTSGAASKTVRIVPPRSVSSTSAQFAPRPISAQTSAQREFVLDEKLEEEAYLARTFVPKPRLGDRTDVGEKLRSVANALQDDAHRRRVLEEKIRMERASYVCYEDHDGGAYMRSRQPIPVEYKSLAKPKPSAACSETELNVPFPKIRYPDGERFGPNPFVELTDDTYGTLYTNDAGEDVEICFVGMSLYMERKENHWVYWPHDRSERPQNFPLRGNVTQGLFEASSFDPPTAPIVREEDVDANQVVWAFEVIAEEGESYILMIVTLVTGEKRMIEIPYTESFFS